MKDGLTKLRLTDRLYTLSVYRGRTFSLMEFDQLFNSGLTEIPITGFVSCTKNESVALDFIANTSSKITGSKVKCILKIKPQKGVDIDDFSDWGTNLVNQKHPGFQAHLEVLIEEGYFKPLSPPKAILENGVPKIDTDGTPWMEVELEELFKPIR